MISHRRRQCRSIKVGVPPCRKTAVLSDCRITTLLAWSRECACRLKRRSNPGSQRLRFHVLLLQPTRLMRTVRSPSRRRGWWSATKAASVASVVSCLVLHHCHISLLTGNIGWSLSLPPTLLFDWYFHASWQSSAHASLMQTNTAAGKSQSFPCRLIPGVALDDLVYLCTKIARQMDTQVKAM